MYPDLESTLLAVLRPAILQVLHLEEIFEQLPKVRVPLPCSELASAQYAGNVSGKSWRPPLVRSLLRGCPDWLGITTVYSSICQYSLLRHIKEYPDSLYF